MPNLNYILSKKFDETYTISFIGGPQEIKDQGTSFKTNVINGVSNIKSFTDQTDGETSGAYFTKFFKYKNGANWSDLLPINSITSTTFNHCVDLELELFYFRTINDANSLNTSLYVNNIAISGDYVLSTFDSEAALPNKGDTVLLKPKDIYKIFSLTGFAVSSAPHNYYEIKYRFTQDGGRTHTPWENLTKENISTAKISPIRFAQVEYSITNTGDQGLLVYDIVLEGDFQNVSANYLKTNRYGLKEDCITALQNLPGAPGSNTLDRDFYTSCLGSYNQNTDVSKDIALTNQSNTSSMWNPYSTNKITSFANTLANNVSNILGWTVEYHLTDPDGNGIDKYVHEYTLKNIVDVKYLKIVVPDNKFPGETLIMNQFNLDMFDTFEIHITKDEFKNAFGITKRPSEDDIIYICQTNMMYYIKHAQAFRSVMNASSYYKIMLEKYEQKTNIRNTIQESQDKINEHVGNTTWDELFGEDMKLEEDKIANKEQFYPTEFDKIRLKISSKVPIVQESIIIDNFKTIKQYYDFSNTAIKNKNAVNYAKSDNTLLKSDNRSFIFWVKFNNSYDPNIRPNNNMFINFNIKSGVEFNLLNNFDPTINVGYKIYYQGDNLFFKLNNNVHKINKKLLTNVWYACVVNLNQRQETLSFHIYRRNNNVNTTLFQDISFIKTTAVYDSVEYNDLLTNGFKPVDNTEDNNCTGFELVSTTEVSITPTEFKHDINLTLQGSNIKYTNLRILDEVIPTDSITNLLKEEELRDAQHLILGDNATKQLITRTYFNKQFR